jgi:hypothetical protein
LYTTKSHGIEEINEGKRAFAEYRKYPRYMCSGMQGIMNEARKLLEIVSMAYYYQGYHVFKPNSTLSDYVT